MDSARGLSAWRSLRWVFLPVLSLLLVAAASAPRFGGTTEGGTASDGGVPQQQCGPMDVAFVVDVTGSMQPPIDNVKAAIPQLLDQVVAASAGDYRAELVVFRDDVNVMARRPSVLRTRVRQG